MNRNYDVIIAGCGAAGLYGALNLPGELKVLVLSKMQKDLCNTALAQIKFCNISTAIAYII